MNSFISTDFLLGEFSFKINESLFLGDEKIKQNCNKLTKKCFDQINVQVEKVYKKHLRLTSCNHFTSFIHKNLTQLVFLNLNLLKVFLDRIEDVVNLNSLTLNQTFEEVDFNQLILHLIINKKIKVVALNKKLISFSQKIKLEQLVNGVRKGLIIKDINGKKFGPAFVDWTYYNESTKTSFLKGLRETAARAFNIYKLENIDTLPDVCDLGCGAGRDSIPLAMLGCRIHAIDSDAPALKIFSENVLKYLSTEKQQNIIMINDTKVQPESYIAKSSVDILVSSYTFPYRPKELFESCFSQYVSFLKPGGLLAAQFFGPFEGSSVSMTYHTRMDLKFLFNKYKFELLHLKTEKQKDINIYGGDEPFCGDLYHVVAKKK